MNALPLIIGHRGASRYAPENTLAAFRAAAEAGAAGVEFDVRLAKDGVPVVIHDETLVRTGLRDDKVADLTSMQLAAIDVGSWFNRKHPKRARAEFSQETVPTLNQTLSLVGSFKGPIYVELKVDEGDPSELVRAVCDVIRGSPLLPQIIVKSFRLAAIPEVRCQLPTVSTAALFAPRIMNFLRRRKHIVTIAREFGADQISLHRSMVTRRLVDRAIEANLAVTVWTADDPIWLKRCRKLGIGALITNDPGCLIAETGELQNNG